ncbi:DUF6907 domain-containing protein [Streptomyces synnematoformans]|uniref:Uncharacterized protein n=1 Tax=Streptomyces synnematoformans TaxID=415721 RepID=A0ABN2Y094_9ACTN
MSMTVEHTVNPSPSLAGADPDQPVPFALTAAAEKPAERTVATLVAGVPTVITCPSWCVKNHAAETDVMCIEDVSHAGSETVLTVPTFGGGTEEALDVRLVQWPHCQRGRPYVSLRSPGEDCTDLTAAAASAFADQVIAHGVALRQLARQLAAVELLEDPGAGR